MKYFSKLSAMFKETTVLSEIILGTVYVARIPEIYNALVTTSTPVHSTFDCVYDIPYMYLLSHVWQSPYACGKLTCPDHLHGQRASSPFAYTVTLRLVIMVHGIHSPITSDFENYLTKPAARDSTTETFFLERDTWYKLSKTKFGHRKRETER